MIQEIADGYNAFLDNSTNSSGWDIQSMNSTSIENCFDSMVEGDKTTARHFITAASVSFVAVIVERINLY